MLDVNRLPLEGEGGLIEMLRTLVDPRKRRGVRHPLVTVVAISPTFAAWSFLGREWMLVSA
jgi:hypothetical protein